MKLAVVVSGLLCSTTLVAALEPLAPTGGMVVSLVPDAQKKVMDLQTLSERILLLQDDRKSGGALNRGGRWRVPKPLVLEFRATEDEKGPWKVEIGKRTDLSDARTWYVPAPGTDDLTGRSVASCVTQNVVKITMSMANLEIATRYYWRVSYRGYCGFGCHAKHGCKVCENRTESPIASFVTEDLAPRWIVIEGDVGNIRDLGGRIGLDGRRVRQGLAYRGQAFNDNSVNGELQGRNRLTVEDVRYLADTLGIKTDLDLRGIGETADMTASPLGENVKLLQHPSFAYQRIFEPEGMEMMAKNFRLFCDRKNYPVYFHCIAGADRTGSLSYVLNGVLGVSRQELETDWESTFYPNIPDENPDPNFGRRESHFNDGFAKYGDADTPWNERIVLYLKACGITDSEIETFRDIMLESKAGTGKLGKGAGIERRKPEDYKLAVLPSEAHMDWLKRGIISIVHFGLNTYTDQEWGFGDADPNLFNPTKLDVRQWVAAAKAGGIRCMVLVAKHHDGFCLWPSKLNADYTVANSPWKGGKGDLVKDLRDACVEAGLDFGVYLSPWDRHHAEYARPAYVDYFHKQWDDIMANYGPISEIWLDGANGGDGWYGGAKEKRSIPKDYYNLPWLQERLVRNYPRAVTFQGMGANCVRWCDNEAGFNAETCRHVVDGYWRPPEADTPLRGGWFWHPYDAPKSLKVLVDTYFWCVGRNAVLNLGLAPNREGLIGEDDVTRLKELGDYVRAYESSDVANDAKLETSSDGRIVTLTVEKPVEFNAIDLGENIRRGQCVDAFAVEAKIGGVWKELAKATTIGYRRILRIPETEATAVRLVVTKATVNPEICSFRLRVAPEVAETFVASGLDFISKSKLKIETSTDPMCVYIRPSEMPNLKLRGFAYKPNAESLDGIVDRWAVDVWRDGRGWVCAEEGEFGNMRANPTTQTVVFKKLVEGRVLRIRAVRAVEGKPHFLVQQLDVFK